MKFNITITALGAAISTTGGCAAPLIETPFDIANYEGTFPVYSSTPPDKGITLVTPDLTKPDSIISLDTSLFKRATGDIYCTVPFRKQSVLDAWLFEGMGYMRNKGSVLCWIPPANQMSNDGWHRFSCSWNTGIFGYNVIKDVHVGYPCSRFGDAAENIWRTCDTGRGNWPAPPDTAADGNLFQGIDILHEVNGKLHQMAGVFSEPC